MEQMGKLFGFLLACPELFQMSPQRRNVESDVLQAKRTIVLASIGLFGARPFDW